MVERQQRLAFATAFVAVVIAALLSSGDVRADILIKNVTLYDGTGAPSRAGVSVLVKGERIAAISTDKIAAGRARVIDGTGKYLIPGLMDSHIHLRGNQGGPPGPDGKPGFNRRSALTALDSYLYYGVTSVYDSGNDPAFIFPLRAEERAGKIISPHIFAAGGTISVPGGYGAGATSLKVTSWEQAKAELDRRFADEKPDMLKMIIDRMGIFANRTVPTLEAGMVKQILDYAHEKGYRVTVHAPTEFDQTIGMAGNMDAYAHPVTRSLVNAAHIKQLAERKIPVSTTLGAFSNIARIGDEPKMYDDPLYRAVATDEEIAQMHDQRQGYMAAGLSGMFKGMVPYMKDNVRKMHDAGVILTSGTDNTLGARLQQELEILNQIGISPFDIIKIATLNGAIYVNRANDMGSVETSKIADLVLLRADPAADVKNFRAIDVVIKGGKQVDLTKLDLPVNKKK
ncbi:MAG: hypothetical protein EXR11_13995 [Rhodospirillaceae bacterium]|nr:hypothetical protein [Rhodospirillaceae bacterium]